MITGTTPPSTYLEQEYRDQDQKALDEVNAQKTVRVLVRHAEDTVDLVTLADMLGLEAELGDLVDELKGGDHERHRRYEAAVEELAAHRADAIAAVAAAAAAVKRNTVNKSKARARAAEKKAE